MHKNSLIKKPKFTSKIYDTTDWTTNNNNTHVAQYLIKLKKPDNEIWSVNKKNVFDKKMSLKNPKTFRKC